MISIFLRHQTALIRHDEKSIAVIAPLLCRIKYYLVWKLTWGYFFSLQQWGLMWLLVINTNSVATTNWGNIIFTKVTEDQQLTFSTIRPTCLFVCYVSPGMHRQRACWVIQTMKFRSLHLWVCMNPRLQNAYQQYIMALHKHLSVSSYSFKYMKLLWSLQAASSVNAKSVSMAWCYDSQYEKHKYETGSRWCH